MKNITLQFINLKNLIIDVVKFSFVRLYAVPVTGLMLDEEDTCCGGGCGCSSKCCGRDK